MKTNGGFQKLQMIEGDDVTGSCYSLSQKSSTNLNNFDFTAAYQAS